MASTKKSTKSAGTSAVPKLTKKKRAELKDELATRAKRARKDAVKAKKDAAKVKEKAKKDAAKAKERAKKDTDRAKEKAKKDLAKAKDAAKKDAEKAKADAKRLTKTAVKVAVTAPVASPAGETYAVLRAKARELRIPNYSRMSKAELQRRLAERG